MNLEIEIKITAGNYGPTLAKTSLSIENETLPEIPVAMLASLIDGAKVQAMTKLAQKTEVES